MAFLKSDGRASRAQQRFDRIALVVATLGGIALGCQLDYQLAHLPSGYVAPINDLAAVVLSVLLASAGVLCLIWWRTRRLGVGCIIAGILTITTYMAGARVLLKLERIPWAPPPIHLDASQHTRVVIRFRPGTSDQQIDDFIQSYLPEMPDWSDALYRMPGQTRQGPGIAVPISDAAYRQYGSSRIWLKMLEKNVSGFMVVMRHKNRVASVDLQTSP